MSDNKSYTGKTGTTNSDRNCTYWVRDDGYEFITDPNEKILNLSRLTAYAEYGKEIHTADAHHELPALKIDAPAFLDAIPRGEHLRFHHSDPDVTEVDGIPLLRKGP